MRGCCPGGGSAAFRPRDGDRAGLERVRGGVQSRSTTPADAGRGFGDLLDK